MASKPTTGIWYWDEILKTLEFENYNTSAHPKGKGKKRKKSIRFQVEKSKSIGSSTADKQSLITANRPNPKNFRSPLNAKSLDQPSSSMELHKRSQGFVTLDDVKNVAIGLLDKGKRRRMSSFSAVVKTQLLDDFLMALLLYLSRHLERISVDKEPKALVTTSSLTEQSELNVLSAEKYFAHMYCRLILGVGIPEEHQTACEGSNASIILRDWSFFQSFYSFCTRMAWITFRQQNLPLIEEEVGRLLHSEAFNPARRQKEDLEEEQRKSSFGKKIRVQKWTRNYQRRPINDIISQRSPALIALIPLPKDKAGYLFQKHSLHPRTTYGSDENCKWLDLLPTVFPQTIGIIGEPRKEFDLDTLAPLTEEERAKKKEGARFDAHELELECHTEDREADPKQ